MKLEKCPFCKSRTDVEVLEDGIGVKKYRAACYGCGIKTK